MTTAEYAINFFDRTGATLWTGCTCPTRGEAQALAEQMTRDTGLHHFAEAV